LRSNRIYHTYIMGVSAPATVAGGHKDAPTLPHPDISALWDPRVDVVGVRGGSYGDQVNGNHICTIPTPFVARTAKHRISRGPL
jgi:hypothetical protein